MESKSLNPDNITVTLDGREIKDIVSASYVERESHSKFDFTYYYRRGNRYYFRNFYGFIITAITDKPLNLKYGAKGKLNIQTE